tara:strand:+ start:368 stop:640 length:273 start_codon:yes stop_codon:yes gene_type:complete
MNNDGKGQWDKFTEQIRRIKMLNGTEIKAGSVMTPAGVKLSKTREEAVRQGRVDSLKRGEGFKLQRGEDIDRATEQLAQDYVDDLLNRLI